MNDMVLKEFARTIKRMRKLTKKYEDAVAQHKTLDEVFKQVSRHRDDLITENESLKTRIKRDGKEGRR